MNVVEQPDPIVIIGTASDQDILDHSEAAKLFLADTRAEQHADWGRDVEATIEIVA